MRVTRSRSKLRGAAGAGSTAASTATRRRSTRRSAGEVHTSVGNGACDAMVPKQAASAALGGAAGKGTGELTAAAAGLVPAATTAAQVQPQVLGRQRVRAVQIAEAAVVNEACGESNALHEFMFHLR